MCIDEKKLRVILSDYSFLRERNQAQFEFFSKNFNFSMRCRLYPIECIPLSVCLWHAKKDMIYA